MLFKFLKNVFLKIVPVKVERRYATYTVYIMQQQQRVQQKMVFVIIAIVVILAVDILQIYRAFSATTKI